MQGQRKTIKFIILLLAATVILAACGKKDDSSTSESASLASSSMVESSSASVSTSMPATESGLPQDTAAQAGSGSVAPAAAPAIQMEPGKFIHLDDTRFPDDRAPYFEILDTSRAQFHVNTGMGLGYAHGSYTVNGSSLVFTIEDIEAESEFWGETFTTLSFTINDKNNLTYTGDAFGLTLPGNIFTREGMPVYVPPETEEPVPSTPPSSPADTAPPAASPSSPAASASSQPSASSAPAGGSSVMEDVSGSAVSEPEKTDGGGFPWLIILIAAGSVVAGSGLTILLLMIMRRGKGQPAGEASSQAETFSTDEDITAAKEQLKAAKASKKAEKTAQKNAKKVAAQAAKKEKMAAKAAQSAEKAAAKAKKAAAAAESAKAMTKDEPAKPGGADDAKDEPASRKPPKDSD